MVSNLMDARHYWPALRAIVTALAAFATLRLGRGGLLKSPKRLEQICVVVDISNETEGDKRIWLPRFHRRVVCTEVEDPFAASDEPPPYYFEGVSHKKALQNWEDTRTWRKENHIGTILRRPPKKHDLIRSLFPTSLYQHDRAGNVVMVEKWGEVDVHRIRRLGIPFDEIINTYMYDTEWLWRIANPHPEDKITLIMDLKDVSFETFTAWDTMRLIKKRIEIGCNHYPNRASHLLVVNVPPFFASVYRFAEPILSSETKKKITILTQEDVARGKMTKFIAPKNLLPEYGGKCRVPFGASSLDMKLKRFAKKPIKL
jgi:CRAL/TRIO domain